MVKKFVFISLLVSSACLLQGCLFAAIGLGSTATKVAADPRTTGSQVDDITLYTKVNAAINNEELKSFFADSRINASAYNGNVLLVGQAANSEQIRKATQLADDIQGVENVYNQVQIAPVISIGTVTNDSWITSKVKSALISNTNTKARDIKVVTENSVVYLIGLATRDEAADAAYVASNISGVTDVVKIFTYID